MFSNPEKNIALLDIREGMKVADLGVGAGYYTKILSKKVGPNGHVYAVDIIRDMVKTLENELKISDTKNVTCIWGDVEKIGGTKIKDHTMDKVVLSNILFQVEDKLGLIDEAKRIVKNDGLIMLIDWQDSFGGIGPAPMYIVTESRAKELFAKRGLTKAESVSIPDHHYGIIFRQ